MKEQMLPHVERDTINFLLENMRESSKVGKVWVAQFEKENELLLKNIRFWAKLQKNPEEALNGALYVYTALRAQAVVDSIEIKIGIGS